jgi:predicted ArsR family transcriptional regulator
MRMLMIAALFALGTSAGAQNQTVGRGRTQQAYSADARDSSLVAAETASRISEQAVQRAGAWDGASRQENPGLARIT